MTRVQTSALRSFESPWLNSDDLCAYIRCSTPKAARKWAARHGVQAAHAGRKVLYARRDVDAALTRGMRVIRGGLRKAG